MDFISRKYTVLMGNEPLTLWIKNDQVQSAKFMDKRVQLFLDSEAIKLIQDNPTKIVNGNNLLQSENFTKAASQMMSSKLELAIAKNDKKTLSRFARSELVPENSKLDFIQAINRPNGLRGVLTRAVNNTNAIFQTLAKKIDRFFDKVTDRVANKKLDPYLSKYQLQHVNKAPPLSQKDLGQHVDPKLMQLAEEFHKQKGLNQRLLPDRLSDQIILNEFLEKAVSKGHSLKDSSVAIHKVGQQAFLEDFQTYYHDYLHEEKKDFESTIKDLQKKLDVYELKEASKNETLKDFEVLSKDLSAVDKIDVLAANKEYLSMKPEEQTKFEDLHIFKCEPLQERLAEIQAIYKNMEEPKVETINGRTPTVDFFSKATQSKITQVWTEQQTKNRSQAEPTRDFMNISAVKFGGVSKPALEKWGETAKSHTKADSNVIEAFINASLRNAKELVKAGVMHEKSPGEYKFVDNFAKQSLYNNIDKTVEKIAEANQGKQITREAHPQNEIKERLESITSQESFKDMLTPNGELDSQKLFEYAQKLQSVAAALHERESPSQAVTKEDLQKANRGSEKQKSQGAENVR